MWNIQTHSLQNPILHLSISLETHVNIPVSLIPRPEGKFMFNNLKHSFLYVMHYKARHNQNWRCISAIDLVIYPHLFLHECGIVYSSYADVTMTLKWHTIWSDLEWISMNTISFSSRFAWHIHCSCHCFCLFRLLYVLHHYSFLLRSHYVYP